MDIASTSGTAEAPPASSSPKKNKPKYSRFTQQELPACKPLLTPKWVLAIFLSIGIVFIPIGVAALIAARDVVEIKDRYDKEGLNVDDPLLHLAMARDIEEFSAKGSVIVVNDFNGRINTQQATIFSSESKNLMWLEEDENVA